ncbi:hypothetical protein EG328_003409 [Venturia inaequalis]|uniref:Rho GTPase activation protein n=1 Tax=Venturia inaequalis TaxID=5025 RepID=A0A8H3VEI5_VENIN|nr:hypothetical protein EG328_003409 [Venturia inaequalis]
MSQYTKKQVMRHFKQRVRGSSISAIAPPPGSVDHNPQMSKAATSILYRSPLNSKANHPIYILNAAALPDTNEVDYDTLLPYVLARLPGEEELVHGAEYEVILFAGGPEDGATSAKKSYPGIGWFLQAYHVLSRAMRKRIQRLYIVHQRTWIRMMFEVFSTVASPKFRKKIVHASTLTDLAKYINIQDLLIPPSAYLRDREVNPDIHVQHVSGRRAFSSRVPLPKNFDGQSRLPRVLRETTNFILLDENIITEGMFRIPPHVKLKEILREAYDRGQKFIVWKEQGVALPMPNYEHMHNITSIIGEIDQHEAYGVHLAAGLMKLWYAELREPLFPSNCYRDLRKIFGNVEEPPSLQSLTELFSTHSEWSILPMMSREICTRHLIPVLAAVSTRSDANKMTAENLAVCFAPTLVCGPDQLEDAKISSIIRRILTAACEMWSQGLRGACGVDERAFALDLQPPSRMDDYEDPLLHEIPEINQHVRHASNESPVSPAGFQEEQKVGFINMRDNDSLSEKEAPPPLPPRQPSVQHDQQSGTIPATRTPLESYMTPPATRRIIVNHNQESGAISEATRSAGAYIPPAPFRRTTMNQESGINPAAPRRSAEVYGRPPRRSTLTLDQDSAIISAATMNQEPGINPAAPRRSAEVYGRPPRRSTLTLDQDSAIISAATRSSVDMGSRPTPRQLFNDHNQESGTTPATTGSSVEMPTRPSLSRVLTTATVDSQDSQNWQAQTEELSVRTENPNLRRKPAPPLTVPPRYSTISSAPDDVSESPSQFTAPSNGFGSPWRKDWSFDTNGVESPVDVSRQNSVLRRKPVTPSSGSWDDGVVGKRGDGKE